jgi:hypothetical protein
MNWPDGAGAPQRPIRLQGILAPISDIRRVGFGLSGGLQRDRQLLQCG